MYSAKNGLLNFPGKSSEENYLFAGWSFGFKSKYQSLLLDTNQDEKDDYDAYVYKYGFKDNSYTKKFLNEDSITPKKMEDFMVKTINSTSSTLESAISKFVTIFTKDSDVKTEQIDLFTPQISKKMFGYKTLSTIKFPRPSAYITAELEEVEYYRGQKTLTYNIEEENNENVSEILKDLSENARLIFENG